MKARNCFVCNGIHSICTIFIRLVAGRAECQNHVLFVDWYENESKLPIVRDEHSLKLSHYSFLALRIEIRTSSVPTIVLFCILCIFCYYFTPTCCDVIASFRELTLILLQRRAIKVLQ